ncbi:MAG: hypothetical protein Q7S39_09505 [Ignavibacteria bacterium]|nr:hypothetical protein [Ignavibacteria bacterium]
MLIMFLWYSTIRKYNSTLITTTLNIISWNGFEVEPTAGIEPATYSLRMRIKINHNMNIQ